MKISYKLDFDVSIDPYRQDTGGLTTPSLYLYMKDDEVVVILDQNNPGQTGQDPSDFLDVEIDLPGYMPNEDDLEEYLESERAQELIERIYDGYDTGWTGGYPGNGWRCAVLDEDATEAVSEMESDIAEIGETNVVTWTCDEWFGQSGIGEHTKASEIYEFIQDPTCGDDNVRLADDVNDYMLSKWAKPIVEHLVGESVDDFNVVERDGNNVKIIHENGAEVKAIVDEEDEITQITEIKAVEHVFEDWQLN